MRAACAGHCRVTNFPQINSMGCRSHHTLRKGSANSAVNGSSRSRNSLFKKNKLDGWQARRATDVSLNLGRRQRELASEDAFLQSEGLSGHAQSEEADVTLREALRVLADLASVTEQSAPDGKSLRWALLRSTKFQRGSHQGSESGQRPDLHAGMYFRTCRAGRVTRWSRRSSSGCGARSRASRRRSGSRCAND